MATSLKISSPARSGGPDKHTQKAADMLPQQQKVFESYQNARLNSQGLVHPQSMLVRLSSDTQNQ